MYDYPLYFDDDHYVLESEDITVSVLLLLGICLPGLGWIITLSLCHKRWERKHVTFCLVTLLITHTLQLIISPFIVETVLTGVPCWHASWWCTTVYIMFSVSRFCGLVLHLCVALEKISSLRHRAIKGLFWVCSVCLLYILFAVLVHLVDVNYIFFNIMNIFFGLIALCTAAAACVVALKPLPTRDLTAKCQCLKVLTVAMFTFMILYVLEFLYQIIQTIRPAGIERVSYVVHYLPCLRPITDCVLFWFVCMDRKREQQTTGVELNSPILDSFQSVTSPSQTALKEDHGEGPPIMEDEM